MIRKWFWGVLLTLSVTAALQGQSRESVLKAIQQTSKWSPADQPTQYDEKNIETFAGKRAPLLNHYGFSGLTTQTWNGEGGTVHLALYEMSDASAAYGLFTLDRNIEDPGFSRIPVGAEGFRVGNRAEFWQSKYVVKLEGSAAATDGLARAISESIFGSSRKPPVSTHLPPENLIQGSERYAVDASGIGRNLDIDPQSLGFDDSVEVATADYRVNGKTAHLLLLMYPTQQMAKKYEEQWAANSPDDAAFRKRVSALVALVRGSKDPAVAKAVLDGVNYETQVTWDQPRPDISMKDVILTIFTFIGLALVFTVVVGLSYGGVRIFVKARYPDRVFDRAQDMEIIQLKLAQGVTQKQLTE
jgi:Family of unknown function (DUF6599)